MNAREFFFLVSSMRRAQRDYFNTREQLDLRRARALENEVDKEIDRVKQILLKERSDPDEGLIRS